MIAYLTQTRNVCFLTIHADRFAERHLGQRVDFAHKREARAYCKANNITPWNF